MTSDYRTERPLKAERSVDTPVNTFSAFLGAMNEYRLSIALLECHTCRLTPNALLRASKLNSTVHVEEHTQKKEKTIEEVAWKQP